MSENFAELFEESLIEIDMTPGAIVTGIVIEIDSDWVTVHAGLKSEGVIPRIQFLDEQGNLSLEIGDEVKVALETVEDGFGETRLSREKAKLAESWMKLEAAYEKNDIVTGVINGKVKGGFTVDLNDIRAFLPGSLVDVRPVRDTLHLEGQELEFRLIKLDQKRNNVVVSRRAVLESVSTEERDALLEKLQEGMSVKGMVKNLTDYGAFVDLGGVDGLLHITDMSWKRIKHPSEIVNVGDEIDVKILKYDRDRNRVSLGLKQLGEDPWVAIKARYPEKIQVKAVVTNLTDYGCFAELEEGVEGLVHVSEMDWTNKNIHPSKVVQLGDEIDVMILDIDEERRRISLGIKQCFQNPWDGFAESFKKGEKISGSIKSITDFGIFIGLDGNIDGLVHLSDISWDEPGEEAVREYKKGDEIETVILREGVEGVLRASELSRDKVEDARNVLNEGDEIEVKIVFVDRKTRVLSLSVKAIEIDDEKSAIQDHKKTDAADASLGTIGDLIKAEMDKS